MGVNGIYGLSGSGMDIESLVKVGMMSKQNEYDKMAQKYTKNEWMKSDYLNISNTITTFNNSTLHDYKLSSTMNAKIAESSNSAVKVTAGSSATNMNHTVEVESLSANAYLIGTNKLTRYAVTSDTVNSSSINLADVLFSDVVVEGDKIRGHVAAGSSNVQNADTTSYTFGKTTRTVQVTSADSRYNSANAYWQKQTGTDGNGDPIYTSYAAGTDPTQDPGTEPAYTATAEPQQSSTWPRQWSYNGSTYNSQSAAQTAYQNDIDNWKATDSTYRAWKAQKALYDDDYTANPSAWRQVSDTIEDVSNASMSATAFKFTISDGTKSGDIEYTYDQLITGGKTLNDLASDINKLGLNIRASYDVGHDQFSLYNKESGEKNTIEITIGTDEGTSTGARVAHTTKNFLDNLGLYQSVNGQLEGQTGAASTNASGQKNSLLFDLGGTTTKTGRDNEIIIDGVTYKESSNKVTVDGVTYTALDTTKDADGNRRIATVTITQDTDAIIDKVKSFVSDYNKLLSSLYEKYDEKADSNYKPLTQSQKDSMKEDQIEKWEEKAKKGMLYHDQTLGKIIQEMRSAVTSKVEGLDSDYNSIFSLGISTTGLKGQLVLDEDKLKKALSEDSEAVYNVFAKLGNQTKTVNGQSVEDTSYNGIAQRLGDILTTATRNIRTRAGSSADITEDSDLNNLMRNLQTRMSNFKRMMNSFEDALYKRYDKMESMLAKLGTQLSFVMGGNS